MGLLSQKTTVLQDCGRARFHHCWRISTCTGSRSGSTVRTVPVGGPTPSSCGTPMTSWSWLVINLGNWSEWIEGLLEGRFRLTVNREKTRIVKLHEPGQSLNFLGFTLRYDRDLYGRDHRYLNVFPSTKAMARARDRIRELTGPRRCFVPIRQMVDDINRWSKGWSGYFRPGYPRKCFRELNRFMSASIDASLATSESTSLPYPGRRVVLRPSATPRLAALVDDSRLTPCACLGPRGFGQAVCGKSACTV